MCSGSSPNAAGGVPLSVFRIEKQKRTIRFKINDCCGAMAIFLFTVARAASNRDVQYRFQHSGETVSRYFHIVSNAHNRLAPEYIKFPDSNEIPMAITNNSKFYNFFNNCIGALDGTHIQARVSRESGCR